MICASSGLPAYPLGGLLGRLGAVFGAPGAVLERRNAEKARKRKTLKKTMKINDLCHLGPSWEASWRPLRAIWRPIGPSWGHLGRLGAIFWRIGAFLGRLEGLLRPSWPVLGPAWFRKSHAGRRWEPQSARDKPR